MTLTTSTPTSANVNTDAYSKWGSDIHIVRSCIKMNLSAISTTIYTAMKVLKQHSSLKVIKEEKKKVFEEKFPKDVEIAFDLSNCVITDGKKTCDDNLFRYHGQVAIDGEKKDEPPQIHNYYIFATHLMLYRLSEAKQWFIDGTFSVAPSGYMQLLIIMVYIPEYKIFYPASYALMTGKSEKLYLSVFQAIINVSNQEDLTLKPTVIMTDFETGMSNALKAAFHINDKNLVGCYFHYTKALIKRAQNLSILMKKTG